MEKLKYKADSIIKNHVLFASGAGAIPVPLLDFAGVTAVQLDMVKKITNLYGKNYSENVGKAFIASITSTSLARMGASAIKAIPGIGTILGGVSMSIMSGASTYALGNVIVEFMQRGVGLEDIDEKLARKIYKEEFEKGKKFAQDIQAEESTESAKKTDTRPPPKAQPENDIYAELLKLGELRDKKIITDKEFAKMKKDIIDRY